MPELNMTTTKTQTVTFLQATESEFIVTTVRILLVIPTISSNPRNCA